MQSADEADLTLVLNNLQNVAAAEAEFLCDSNDLQNARARNSM
jgi:hypothetical protein